MTYEYAITAGPGLLIDHGELMIDDAGTELAISRTLPQFWEVQDFADLAFKNKYTILIGPIEYEGSGETIRLKGDE